MSCCYSECPKIVLVRRASPCPPPTTVPPTTRPRTCTDDFTAPTRALAGAAAYKINGWTPAPSNCTCITVPDPPRNEFILSCNGEVKITGTVLLQLIGQRPSPEETVDLNFDTNLDSKSSATLDTKNLYTGPITSEQPIIVSVDFEFSTLIPTTGQGTNNFSFSAQQSSPNSNIFTAVLQNLAISVEYTPAPDCVCV